MRGCVMTHPLSFLGINRDVPNKINAMICEDICIRGEKCSSKLGFFRSFICIFAF